MNTLQLLPQESVRLTDQAFIKNNSRSGWKPGHLSLTNKRLVLHQPARNIFRTSLESISNVATEKKGFILKSVDALTVSFMNSTNQKLSKVWIVVKNPEKWQKAVLSCTKVQVSDVDIEKISSELEKVDRSILRTISEKQYATIRGLAVLYNAPNHMDVLHRIRNVINPLSEKILGFPLLVFEKSRVEPITGEKILFSWWLIGELDTSPQQTAPLLDLFDEGDHLLLIIELNCAQEKDIQLSLKGDRLRLVCDTQDQKYSEDVLLPSEVEPDRIEKHYNNGVLEVKVGKIIS